MRLPKWGGSRSGVCFSLLLVPIPVAVTFASRVHQGHQRGGADSHVKVQGLARQPLPASTNSNVGR